MRKLKFRIWDKVNNCFYKPTYEAYKGRLEDLSIDLSGELKMRTYENPAIHESLFPNRFVIQQYTGLKDKNGKEIYDGDIIDKHGYTITWVDGSDTANLGMPVGWYEQRDNFESYRQLEVGDEIEVIGNIYENPELITA